MPYKKAILIFLGVLVFIGIVAITVGYSVYGRIVSGAYSVYVNTPKSSLRQKKLNVDGQNQISLLYIGVEGDPLTKKNANRRAETAVVVTLNPKTNQTTLVELPTDLSLSIEGHDEKITIAEAYHEGKEDLVIQTVQQLLNIPVDIFVAVDEANAVGLIDSLGGVEITSELTQTIGGVNYTPGSKQVISGQQASQLLKTKGSNSADSQRLLDMKAQIFVNTADRLNQVSNVFNYKKYLSAFTATVQTNMSLDEMRSIQTLYKNSFGKVVFEQIKITETTDGTTTTRGISDEELLHMSNLLRGQLGFVALTDLTNPGKDDRLEEGTVQNAKEESSSSSSSESQPVPPEPEAPVEPAYEPPVYEEPAYQQSVNEEPETSLPTPPVDSSSSTPTPPVESSSSNTAPVEPEQPSTPVEPEAPSNPAETPPLSPDGSQ
ncbi:LCP family glycopolymer transferase [Granulicatella seriolae]|uniref:LCP family protein n=1 Tax=Granulicatella seriolae TaxID=2967226 RepID=A0ABT1WN32_9LACT|nr:LCP family protein [Granulicatella seriolae]